MGGFQELRATFGSLCDKDPGIGSILGPAPDAWKPPSRACWSRWQNMLILLVGKQKEKISDEQAPSICETVDATYSTRSNISTASGFETR